jgi:hypothetical protein
MKMLQKTDYVVYNVICKEVNRWDSDKKIVIYGTKEEAEYDIMPGVDDIAISCSELPHIVQLELLKQINE